MFALAATVLAIFGLAQSDDPREELRLLATRLHGRWLASQIRPGMKSEDAKRILGKFSPSVGFGTLNSSGEYYGQLGFTVYYTHIHEERTSVIEGVALDPVLNFSDVSNLRNRSPFG